MPALLLANILVTLRRLPRRARIAVYTVHGALSLATWVAVQFGVTSFAGVDLATLGGVLLALAPGVTGIAAANAQESRDQSAPEPMPPGGYA